MIIACIAGICLSLQIFDFMEVAGINSKQLQLFIDMVLIENIVDEFECCVRENEEVDYEDIENAAECLIKKIPYAGFCKK